MAKSKATIADLLTLRLDNHDTEIASLIALMDKLTDVIERVCTRIEALELQIEDPKNG